MLFNVPALANNRVPKFIAPITIPKTQATELASIIAAVVEPWRTATPAILASYTPQITDSPSDSDAEIKRAEQEVNILILTLGARVREWVVRMERWHRGKWAGSVYSATNVDLRQVLQGTGVEETLEAFIARNVALISDVSAEAQRRIADAVFRGYQQRLTATEIAADIRKAHKMGKARALRIAGDQNAKLSSALDRERQLEAGFKFGKYRHSGKRHPREWHKARDGKIYELRTRREVKPNGKRLAGGDRILAADYPGFPPFCGCRMGAYLPIEAELAALQS